MEHNRSHLLWESPYNRGVAPSGLSKIRSERLLRRIALPALRRDFGSRCCYCTGSEDEKGGIENFDVEHFRPKSDEDFSHLAFEYSNLYYSCRGCNLAKSKKWPKPNTLDRHFVDPCEEAIYPKYLQILNGEIQSLRPPGAFLLEVFRFNDRPGVKRFLQLREFSSKMRTAIRGGNFSEAAALLDNVEQILLFDRD
jgi:hypothetical protein